MANRRSKQTHGVNCCLSFHPGNVFRNSATICDCFSSVVVMAALVIASFTLFVAVYRSEVQRSDPLPLHFNACRHGPVFNLLSSLMQRITVVFHPGGQALSPGISVWKPLSKQPAADSFTPA